MNIKKFNKTFWIIVLAVVLTGCQQMKTANAPFKHNTPLIQRQYKKRWGS